MRRVAVLSALLAALVLAAPAAARDFSPLPANWQKGMNVAASRYDDFSGPRFEYWMDRLAHHDHAGTAMFVTRWLQY